MARTKGANAAQTRETIYAAVRSVVVRGGARAITIESVARDAGLSKASVGAHTITGLIEHLIDYAFEPLSGLFSQAGSTKGHGMFDRIERLFIHDRDLAILVFQTSAVATTSIDGDRCDTPIANLRNLFIARRQRAESILRDALRRDEFSPDTHTAVCASAIVDRYLLAACGAALNVERPSFP